MNSYNHIQAYPENIITYVSTFYSKNLLSYLIRRVSGFKQEIIVSSFKLYLADNVAKKNNYPPSAAALV